MTESNALEINLMIREDKFNRMLLAVFGNKTTITDIDFVFDHNGRRFAIETKEVDMNKAYWEIEESQLIIMKAIDNIFPTYYVFHDKDLEKFHIIRASRIDNILNRVTYKNGKALSVIKVYPSMTTSRTKEQFFDFCKTLMRL